MKTEEGEVIPRFEFEETIERTLTNNEDRYRFLHYVTVVFDTAKDILFPPSETVDGKPFLFNSAVRSLDYKLRLFDASDDKKEPDLIYFNGQQCRSSDLIKTSFSYRAEELVAMRYLLNPEKNEERYEKIFELAFRHYLSFLKDMSFLKTEESIILTGNQPVGYTFIPPEINNWIGVMENMFEKAWMPKLKKKVPDFDRNPSKIKCYLSLNFG